MKLFRYSIVLSVLFAVISCADKGPKFEVEGQVAGADSSVLYLERRELNKIVMLDSVDLAKTKGEFKFKQASTTYPEFYVLRLDGQVINFAMDSTQNLIVKASKDDFATNYTLGGDAAYNNVLIKDAVLAQYAANNDLQVALDKFNKKEINEQEYLAQVQLVLNKYRDTAKNIIFKDLRGPAAYFALFQKIRGYLFFDPYDRADYKMFAAVATSWDQFNGESPRSKQLKDFTLTAMGVRKQSEQGLLADSTKIGELDASTYYDINLPNASGDLVSLSASKGKPVLLDFTIYQDEKSPLHNMQLNKIYQKYKSQLEIYQVAFDADAHLWKNAAVNIPWVAVHDLKSVNSELFLKYNIRALPTIYLLNTKGEIIKRIAPADNLEAEIEKIL